MAQLSLREYYKSHLYEYAYNKGYDDAKKDTPNPCGDVRDIYFKDEMDYNICANYYDSYIGGVEDWTEDDENFMYGLGFVPEDFEPEEEDEMTRAEFEREFREGR